jgi:hypothetical protein
VSDSAETSTPQVVHRWVGIVGLFVAPTTVITAICVYFGFVSTRQFLSYFGIDSNAIGFTTSDYVMTSISVLYAPILVLLAAWAGLLWIGVYARSVAADGRRPGLIRGMGWAAVVVGALLAVRGIVGVLASQFAVIHSTLLTPMALGVGTVLLVIGYWLLTKPGTDVTPRPFASAERASLFVAAAVVVMALFWVTNLFATRYGEMEAESTAAKLWSKETAVILETTERLDPPRKLIRESTVAASEVVMYRYECFRPLVVRGTQWVLVPAKWTPENGYAVVVADDSANRISAIRQRGVALSGAADWDAAKRGGWQCPEVGPA